MITTLGEVDGGGGTLLSLLSASHLPLALLVFDFETTIPEKHMMVLCVCGICACVCVCVVFVGQGRSTMNEGFYQTSTLIIVVSMRRRKGELRSIVGGTSQERDHYWNYVVVLHMSTRNDLGTLLLTLPSYICTITRRDVAPFQPHHHEKISRRAGRFSS